MLQQETPEDYVIATNENRTVREFVETAFHTAGIEIVWEGSGAAEVGKDAADGRTIVRVDPALFRPAEVDALLGDPAKAMAELGWRREIGFTELVERMVRHDLELLRTR